MTRSTSPPAIPESKFALWVPRRALALDAREAGAAADLARWRTLRLHFRRSPTRQRLNLAPARPDAGAAVPRRNFIARLFGLAAGGALFGRAGVARAAPDATTGIDPFLGEIALVAFNVVPSGWARCDGQLLSIVQNQALFSLIGTTYGGDNSVTFKLPDLRGRAPIHQGTGPGLSSHNLGEAAGAETVTLTTDEMPIHTHAARADASNGVSDSPAGRYPAKNAAGVPAYGTGTGTNLGAAAIDNAGGSQPHGNMPP